MPFEVLLFPRDPSFILSFSSKGNTDKVEQKAGIPKHRPACFAELEKTPKLSELLISKERSLGHPLRTFPCQLRPEHEP